MNFPAVVNSCREFEYTVKSGKYAGESRIGYSVDITLQNYESYSVFSRESFDVGENCVLLIRPGEYSKPVISLVKPIL